MKGNAPDVEGRIQAAAVLAPAALAASLFVLVSAVAESLEAELVSAVSLLFDVSLSLAELLLLPFLPDLRA